MDELRAPHCPTGAAHIRSFGDPAVWSPRLGVTFCDERCSWLTRVMLPFCTGTTSSVRLRRALLPPSAL